MNKKEICNGFLIYQFKNPHPSMASWRAESLKEDVVFMGQRKKECINFAKNYTIKKSISEFEKAARPLIQYLCENHHPHVTAIITPVSCELLEGKEANPRILDYLVD